VNEGNLLVKPYPNPTGFLKFLGLQKIKKTLDRYIFFPSPEIRYVWRAQRILRKLIAGDLQKGKKISLITSLPPHDLALIGLRLKRKFPRIHWIIDWRDLWSFDEYYFNRIPKLYRSRVLDLEERLLRHSDLNVTTNEKAKELLEKHFGLPSTRLAAINHAFHRLDFQKEFITENNSITKMNDGQIRIGFLGQLFKPPKIPGWRVLKAISDVIAAGIEVQFHIYGDGSEMAREAVAQFANNRFFLHPRTSHKESLKKIAHCDYLLLAQSDLPICKVKMNAKLSNYLLLGKPIIALVPKKSAVADIIRETGTGYVIDASSDWGTELSHVFKNHASSKYSIQRNKKAIEAYSWENISRQWLEIIGQVSQT